MEFNPLTAFLFVLCTVKTEKYRSDYCF